MLVALGKRLPESVLRPRLLAAVRRHGGAIAVLALAASAGAMALVGSGAFGRIEAMPGAPKDMALVDTLRQAALGCLLAVLSWAAGAGLASLFRRRSAAFADIVLLGYVLSLPLTALLAAIALVAPHGSLLAGAGLIACIAPLLVRLREILPEAAFRARFSASAQRHGRAIAVLALAAATGAMALVAFGAFGRVQVMPGAPKDIALVADTLRHAVLGCVVAILPWAAGAGLASLFRRRSAAFADIVLLGYVLSLPLTALLAAIALVAPHGSLLAGAGLIACVVPLLTRNPHGRQWIRLGKTAAACLPFAIGLGCWMGLLWHGPTATLSGSPSGDPVFYAGTVWSLARQAFPFLHLGYEGEIYGGYYNLLFSGAGAVLLRHAGIEPLLFICAGAPTAFVVNLALALHAYVQARTGFAARLRDRIVLGLSILVAVRYPYWVSESSPVVYTPALTIALWHLVQKGTNRFWWSVSAVPLAVAGSVLSKVSGAATLVPLALAGLIPHLPRMPRFLRWAAFASALVASLYAAYLVHVFLGPLRSMLESGLFGPESMLVLRHHASLASAAPLLLRDGAKILMIYVGFRLVPWPLACALACGFLTSLVFPWIFFVDFVCAAILLGLVACGDPEASDRVGTPLVAALVMALPAVLLTDPSAKGWLSGLVWTACVGGTVLATLPRRPVRGRAWNPARMVPLFAALVAFGLAAVAGGRLVVDSAWRSGPEMTPKLRDIWTAVRERTPADALIFTDQTGPDMSLLGGWNTYAFMGQRQIFISDYVQSPSLRLDPEKLREVLGRNDAVLAGALHPASLPLTRRYGAYFAVVAVPRTVPPDWSEIYGNGMYTLYGIPWPSPPDRDRM